MKQSRREFIQDKRRLLKKLKKLLSEIRTGCACNKYFGSNMAFYHAVQDAQHAYEKMDDITKPLA